MLQHRKQPAILSTWTHPSRNFYSLKCKLPSHTAVRMSRAVYLPHWKQFFCIPWVTALCNLQKVAQVQCVAVKGDNLKRK